MESIAIKAAKYIPALCVLKIEFDNGKKYNYSPVLKKEYEQFMLAKSKGRFVSEVLKGRGKRV